MQQQLTPQETQAFHIELRKELDKPFPKELLPKDFAIWGEAALQHESMASLQLDHTTYEKIIMYFRGGIEINFFEVPFLVNSILIKTPEQLRSILQDNEGFSYIHIMKEVNNLSQKWNKMVEPIKEATARKVKGHLIRGLNPSNGKLLKL